MIISVVFISDKLFSLKYYIVPFVKLRKMTCQQAMNMDNFIVVIDTTHVFWITSSWATRRVPHVEQDLLTLPKHLRSPQILWWGSCCLVFSFMCNVLCTIICRLYFLAMVLLVYFRSMSVTVPLVSFTPLSIRYAHPKYIKRLTALDLNVINSTTKTVHCLPKGSRICVTKHI